MLNAGAKPLFPPARRCKYGGKIGQDVEDNMRHRITDWNDAYANDPNIPGGERWPALWVEPARHYRETLGETDHAHLDIPYADVDRSRLDLFLPAEQPKGLVVFVHGGFWLRLDKSYWSHLAHGPIAHEIGRANV